MPAVLRKAIKRHVFVREEAVDADAHGDGRIELGDDAAAVAQRNGEDLPCFHAAVQLGRGDRVRHVFDEELPRKRDAPLALHGVSDGAVLARYRERSIIDGERRRARPAHEFVVVFVRHIKGDLHRVSPCGKIADRPAARKRHFGKDACGKRGRECLGRDPPCPLALHFHRVLDKDVRCINGMFGDMDLDGGKSAARLYGNGDSAVLMRSKAALDRIDRRDVVLARERLRLFGRAPDGTGNAVVELPRHRKAGGDGIDGRIEIDGHRLGKLRFDGSERRRDDFDREGSFGAFAPVARRRQNDLVAAHRKAFDPFGEGKFESDLGYGIFRAVFVDARKLHAAFQRVERGRREDVLRRNKGCRHAGERA